MGRCKHKWVTIHEHKDPVFLEDIQIDWCENCGTLRAKNHWGITAFEPDTKPRWSYQRPKSID